MELPISFNSHYRHLSSTAADWKSVADVRERFSLADNVTQSMAAFRSKPPSSHVSTTRTGSRASSIASMNAPVTPTLGGSTAESSNLAKNARRGSTVSLSQSDGKSRPPFGSRSVSELEQLNSYTKNSTEQSRPAVFSSSCSASNTQTGIPKPKAYPSVSSRTSSRKSSHSDLIASASSPHVSVTSLRDTIQPNVSPFGFSRAAPSDRKPISERRGSLEYVSCNPPELSIEKPSGSVVSSSDLDRRQSLPASRVPDNQNGKDK